MKFKTKHDSTKPLLEYLSTVLTEINIKLQQRNFMKQLSLDLLPESITKHFAFRYIDSINNANSDKLVLPCCRTKVGIFSLFYQISKQWNEIPKKYKQTQFIEKFYRDCPQYLTEQVQWKTVC